MLHPVFGRGSRRPLAVVLVALMTELGDDITVEVVAWRWSMLSWLDFWNVIEIVLVILVLGFALGYLCAGKCKKAATKAQEIPVVPLRCEFCSDSVNPKFFPYKSCNFCGACPSYHHGRCCPLLREVPSTPSRTVGTQSQCTYKRKLLTPRFHVLSQQADGVFDVSHSD